MAKYSLLPLAFLFIISCESVVTSSMEKSMDVDTSVKTTDVLRLELNLNSANIETLQELEAQFKLKNISDEEVVYDFPSGCQYGFRVVKDEDALFDSRKNLACTAVISELKLDPDETKEFPISLEKFEINKKLDKGIYQLEAFLLEGHSATISTSFKME